MYKCRFGVMEIVKLISIYQLILNTSLLNRKGKYKLEGFFTNWQPRISLVTGVKVINEVPYWLHLEQLHIG